MREAFPNSPHDPKGNSARLLRSYLEQVLENKQLHRYDIQAGNGSFDERYWSATNKPVLNHLGEVIYIIHSAEDVTVKIKLEQREKVFLDHEKRYHELITAPILICILKDDDYKIALANERTLDMWGRTTDVIGQP